MEKSKKRERELSLQTADIEALLGTDNMANASPEGRQASHPSFVPGLCPILKWSHLSVNNLLWRSLPSPLLPSPPSTSLYLSLFSYPIISGFVERTKHSERFSDIEIVKCQMLVDKNFPGI